MRTSLSSIVSLFISCTNTFHSLAFFRKHHPVSRLFSTVLGLEELTVSYCQFSTEDNHLPQKDTNLWTNSKMLITHFKDGQFMCSKKKVCIGRGIDGRHYVQVQELSDKCSAYPKLFCEFIAGLLRKLYSHCFIIVLSILSN